MVSIAREHLRTFLSDPITAYDPSESYQPNMHPSSPTCWPNGPDFDFPWANPCDEWAFQVLELGGGFRVLLRRTRATLGNGQRLDEYVWSIHLLDVNLRATFCLARTYFHSPNIQNLFNWTSAHKDRVWVLELLKISLERRYTIDALHLPIVVPGIWGGAQEWEGEQQTYHVIAPNGTKLERGENMRVDEVLELFIRENGGV
ncbi:hypothetical protein CPB85DRAFT_1527094 [Mucidula mucida]|nr:hypothetical protein CPB85DRAFT_1527094 [Mucidula mucida]